jgi:hypothetical protein
MPFSFLSWNVEHFRANPDLAARAVRGWPQLTGNARKEFIASISDHASLFARVG